jgi:hypothetical protein
VPGAWRDESFFAVLRSPRILLTPRGSFLQNYEARDGECTPTGICETCAPQEGCSPITNYTSYYVSQFGSATGVDDIKAEVNL